MNSLLDTIRANVRRVMGRIATILDKLSGGKLTPNAITWSGLIMHVFVAYLIAHGSFIWAAILLVIFGLFDTLDGELARLQKRDSSSGMLLDAVTDRMKEVILYSGVAWYVSSTAEPRYAIWAVLACGGSLLVSYVKAKGETAVKGTGLSPNQLNRLFQDGFLRFEVRMFILVVGLLAGYIVSATAIIAVFAWLTAGQRLAIISRKLG